METNRCLDLCCLKRWFRGAKNAKEKSSRLFLEHKKNNWFNNSFKMSSNTLIESNNKVNNNNDCGIESISDSQTHTLIVNHDHISTIPPLPSVSVSHTKRKATCASFKPSNSVWRESIELQKMKREQLVMYFIQLGWNNVESC